MTTRTRLLLGLAFAVVAAPAAAQHPTTPPPPMALRPLTFPPFGSAVLDNGLELIVVENRELPVVSISLRLPAGSSYEPEGLEGLSGFVAELLNKGTATRTADEIAETIEGVGGSLNAGSGFDFFTISSTVLTEHVPLAFELMGDIVLNASFPSEELELARTRMLSSLEAEKSDPGALASRYFAKALYGDHPYGRRETEASVKAITVEGVREYAATRLVPEGALLVVAGDIDLAGVRRQAERHLGQWKGSPPATSFPAPPAARSTEILLVHRPGSAQSNLLVGNLALRPGDASYYGAVVANRVLGGGSDARLFKLLREEKGWTYGAYSSVVRRRDLGFFQASAEVRTPVTDSALTALLEQLNIVRTEAPADSEVTAAKGYLVGSFPRQIETPQQVAGQVSSVKLLGLGDDYLQTYRERLSAVSPTDAAAVARSVIHPDSAVIVAVGDGQAIYETLSAIAPVTIIDTDGEPLSAAALTVTATVLELNREHIVARRDSFQVVYQGNPIGAQVSEVATEGDELIYRETTAVPMAGIRGETVVRFDAASMTVRSVEETGQMQGQSTSTSLTYADGKVTGHIEVPDQSGTPSASDVDMAIIEGVVDGNAMMLLIPALGLAEGASLKANVFSTNDASVKPLTITVAGVEEVTVPAGTFTAFMVDVTGGQTPLKLWVSQETPRRIVRFEIVGQPVVFELVQ
jgi:predicted Zn-dependent peptidase